MTIFRYVLFLISAIQFFFVIAYFFQLPFAAAWWPFPGTTPLTYIFIASIFAAVAASTFWVAATRHYGALAGIALDYFAILTPLSIYAFQIIGEGVANPQLVTFAVACAIGALFGLGLFLWSAWIPLDASISTPRPVRSSFILFILILLFVSARLISQTPNTIPWSITPQLSVLIGWIFIGAAMYFFYGLLRPVWSNAAGQLAGFLAYDLVLIGPFLARLPAAAPEHRNGLLIYIAILIFSGLVAVYYLFFHKPTRLWR